MPPLNLRELDLLKKMWCQYSYANWMVEVSLPVRILNHIINANATDINRQCQQLPQIGY